LLVTETESKRVEILKQLAPGASRFAALINPKNADAEVQSSAVKAAAQANGQQVEIINASTDLDLSRRATTTDFFSSLTHFSSIVDSKS
jgi:ABC-type uncharacterized transport system substrate-binding protein